MAGVVVDDVEEVLTVDETQLDAVPAAGSPSIDAIAKIDDRLVILLDPEGIFAGARPRRRLRRRRMTAPPATRVVVADDSAPHAPGARATRSPTPASTSSARPATATRRSRCAAACGPTP